METIGHVWGMWCGSWMGVDGNVCVRVWGYMGNGSVHGCRLMGNGGWTYCTDREWRNLKLKQI